MTVLSIPLAARVRPYPVPRSPATTEPDHDLGVDPAPAAALEVPPAADIDVPVGRRG